MSVLPTTRLGAAGQQVGVQGLGCMGMSAFYGESDIAESLATLDKALELGVTLYDTADMYGAGHNEELIGPFIRANRENVVLATKFSIRLDPSRPGGRFIDNSPAYIRTAVEASLKRLGIETIDLYYAHRRDPNVPIEEMMGALAELVQQGKIKQIGLSEVTGNELRAAHAVHPVAALQSEWSLFSRDVEKTAVPAAVELGVTFVPYSPLGRGFLTGAFASAEQLGEDDFRRTQPRFTGDNAARNAELLVPINKIAADRGVTPAQVALAWVHQRADVYGLSVVPIPGTRKRTRLAENVAAATLKLTDQELAELEPIAGKVSGDRYADMNFTQAGRE